MTDEKKKHLYNVFEPLLRLDPKTTHNDLVELYYDGIAYIKNNFNDKSRELKSAAMYYLKLEYNKSGLMEALPEKIINIFFDIYDNEFEKYKTQFELISDEDYLLLSFVYSKFN